ncbi:MAG: DNA cytosine methyltransferase [Aphanothece sp. CMT-3BRIN-NPC111]|nr:DNA cytosine methyltransferase [Aphanothece sp. CMT-3BRIN-NPC111]
MRNKLCGGEWLRSEEPRNYQFDTSGGVSIVDLFCGCGGLTFGVLEALYCNGLAGSIKLAIDNNPHALEVYKTNLRVSEDVVCKADIGQLLSGNLGECTQSCEKALIQPLGKIDILVAGPPCQGNSNLNNWTRGDDPRNQLYLKVVRFVELVKPKIIIIENVLKFLH